MKVKSIACIKNELTIGKDYEVLDEDTMFYRIRLDSGYTDLRRKTMFIAHLQSNSKVVDKIESKRLVLVAKERQKLQEEYDCTKGNYEVTGYDRYYKKMERLEHELEALDTYEKQFQDIKETEQRLKSQQQGLEKAVKYIQSKMRDLTCELPASSIYNLKAFINKLNLDKLEHLRKGGIM